MLKAVSQWQCSGM